MRKKLASHADAVEKQISFTKLTKGGYAHTAEDELITGSPSAMIACGD
ncbi:hypothetical protein ACT3S8_16715 [Halomonas sp. AOP42-D2-25]